MLFLLGGAVLALSAVGWAAPAAAGAPAAVRTPSAARAVAPTPQPTGVIEVTFDQSRVEVVVGDRFTLRSRIADPGATASAELLAHLNVVSLTSDVYVDPEDWSSHRTQALAPLAPGGSNTLSWDIQAVNPGSFDIYLVLLPVGATSAGTGPLEASPPVHVTVAGRRTFSAGGALPVAVVVPVLLGLGAAVTRYKVRRAG
jgi:hypothetical protein